MSRSSEGPTQSPTARQGAVPGPHKGVRAAFGVLSLAVMALPLSLAVGCNSLNFLRQSSSREKIADKADAQQQQQQRQVAVMAPAPSTLPGKHSFRLAPYVFLSDFEIDREDPLFKELGQLRDQVSRELLLPPGNAVVQVYLFESQDRYERFMKGRYPDLPTRRAFFVAQPRSIGGAEDLLVYTYRSKRTRQDLRHELTHALLHSVIRGVPLWLDEGLAEYFELPPENKGVNVTHVELLRRGLASGTFKPDISRLERLKDSDLDRMGPAEYREAWAWTHLMLHGNSDARTALLSYLQQLRGTRQPGHLGPKLAQVLPDLSQAFADHLAKLEAEAARRASR